MVLAINIMDGHGLSNKSTPSAPKGGKGDTVLRICSFQKMEYANDSYQQQGRVLQLQR